MKKIEIVTSHNITIVYDLATALQRVLAGVIDIAIVAVYSIAIGIVTGMSSFFFYMLVFPVVMMYHFLFEVYNNGQSPGKMITKLKVVTLKGRTPSVIDLFQRWIFRTVDVTLSMGSLAILFISSSAKNQRIGDIIAETSVINLKSQSFVNLEMLESISDSEIEIMYPAVTRYNDSDMLLVKDILERVKQYPNRENRRMLTQMTNRIMDDLNIRHLDLKPKDFLNQVLTEYIILSRK